MSNLSIEINAPIQEVWKHISNIESHLSWMNDAISIALVDGEPNTVGAKYLCDTQVSFLKTKDTMRVIAYQEPDFMEMEHVGAVKGTGTFRLVSIDPQTTKFVWEENLSFPIYMGASIGKFFGMALLHRIWKKNLENLKFEIENLDK